MIFDTRNKRKKFIMGSDEFPQKGHLSMENSRKNFLLTYPPIQYVLRQQRLICLFVGIGIASILFSIIPSSDHNHHHGSIISNHNDDFSLSAESTQVFRRASFELHHGGVMHDNAGL